MQIVYTVSPGVSKCELSDCKKGGASKETVRDHTNLFCKCAGDFYELREADNAHIDTQEGIERSILPQEMSN